MAVLRWIVLLCLALAPMAEAQGSDLRRLTLRQELLGWEGVGRLALPDGAFCTAVLIAPDQVLTAAHCVVDPRSGLRRTAADLSFLAGYADGVALIARQGKRLVTHPGFDAADRQSLATVRHDLALLELAAPIPTATAAPFAVIALNPSTREVSVISYAEGRTEALSWQMRCPVLGRSNGLLGFDCDVSQGSSGAPVFDRSGRRARIVSIISSEAIDGDRSFALGMELPQLVSELTALLRAAPTGDVPDPRIQRFDPDSADRPAGALFIKP